MHDTAAATAERVLRDYRALCEAAAVVDLGDWTVLQLEGADTAAFLNGTASQEIAPTGAEGARPTLFLTEKGRPVALGWVVLSADSRSAVVLADAGAHQTLRAHLERLRIMEDVEIRGPDGMPHLLGAGGPSRDALAASYAAKVEGARVFAADPITFILPPTPDASAVGAPSSPSIAEPAESAAYEAWRIAVGLPRAGIDFDTERIATELGLSAAISLTKGCYVGQEVVARTAGRGQVRRQRVGFRFQWQGAPVAPRSEIRAGGLPAGYVTSTTKEPGTADGLGMGYLSAEALRQPVSILAIEGPTSTHLQVAPWPL